MLKPIPGYTLYRASDNGHIWSCRKGSFLAERTRSDGYRQVTLCENGSRKQEYVHRLVAKAFVHQPDGFTVVNHKNEDRGDNSAENLEWCTYVYNNNYGTCKEKQRETVGIENLRELARSAAKKRRRRVRDIDSGKEYESIAAACADTGARHGNIVLACQGRIKTCVGRRWEYV